MTSRGADREISALGISIYFVTKRIFIKDMVYRAVRLNTALEERGHRVIEVYPHASKVRLFGRALPKKTTPAGRLFLSDEVGDIVGTEEVESRKLTPTTTTPSSPLTPASSTISAGQTRWASPTRAPPSCPRSPEPAQ